MEREVLRAALAPGSDCLPLEELGRYADGTLSPDDRAVVGAHIRTCVSCQAELTLLQGLTSRPVQPGDQEVVRDGVGRLREAAQRAGEARRSPASRPPRFVPSSISFLATAATLVLLAAVAGQFYFQPGRAPQLPSTVNAPGDVTRSNAVAIRGPVGDQSEAPRQLSWMPFDRAARYHVRLMEVDRREVWSATVTATDVELPPEVRALSVPSKTFLWDVTAYDASAASIAGSGTHAFRVVPR